MTDVDVEAMNTIDDKIRRFTATIQGWRNWKIYQGEYTHDVPDYVIKKVRKIREKVRVIRDRINSGDESIFHEPNVFTRSTISERK